jgi:hypothetical protein
MSMDLSPVYAMRLVMRLVMLLVRVLRASKPRPRAPRGGAVD